MRLPLLAALLLALPAWAQLRVVATVPDLAALATAVGGKHVAVRALSLPTQDPHFVDARPSLAVDLNRANLLLAVGLELEVGWLPVLQTGARNPNILVGRRGFLDCSQLVKRLQVPTTRVDRSQGDIHPGGNPHYLLDPRAALAVAEGIAARLTELDPAHAADYRANLERFRTELEAARASWEKRLAPLKGAPVVAYHDSIVYLADWVGFTPVAFLEPKPGIPPNPSHVAEVLMLARARKVRVLLQEEYYPDTTSKLVASKVPAALVILPGGANVRGNERYLANMEEVVSRLEKAAAARGGG